MARPAKFFDQKIEPAPICRNCEYFDGGGLDAAGIPKNQNGDCLNKQSPNFVINASDTCRHFFPCSTRWPDADHG
jgi:hypothetical protein